MATSYGGFLHSDAPNPMILFFLHCFIILLLLQLHVRSSYPSVTLSHSLLTVLHTPTPGIPWLQTDRAPENAPLILTSFPIMGLPLLVEKIHLLLNLKNAEIEEKMNALREEQKATLDWIEAENKETLEGLRRDAEAKEHELAE
ncbi:hypothetical protein FXO38_04163 [Capsicum annuum]|uniref:Uncharacterized protein n=1 Tax=Capsicum annuum TaxID=4072 RepID=A0A2G2YRB6_CAPAN|nr:hypothetical protein FXO38_04163 [Capsicum annuum]PHT72161.1 hypothetical protein T459_22946 [Capsicum annuum]